MLTPSCLQILGGVMVLALGGAGFYFGMLSPFSPLCATLLVGEAAGIANR